MGQTSLRTEESAENNESVSPPVVQSINTVLTKEEKKELGLNKAGVTDEVLFKVGMEGLTAVKKRVEVDNYGSEKVIEEPDHIVRHKYFDTILRVKGYIRPDAVVDGTINFNLTVTQREEIRGRLKKVIDI